MASKVVSFKLNGRKTEVLVEPLTTLQTVLREQLGYTGTKAGCRQGGCGRCTVLVDGEPMLSCILPVEDVAGTDIMTIEGLTPTDGLHPIQEAFAENNGAQCGYCNSGMILVIKALLDRHSNPGRQEIVEAITGNLCRCTGYEPIIRSAEEAARRLNGA
jgi:carbon-monoxide dehydrogenase small subunit